MKKIFCFLFLILFLIFLQEISFAIETDEDMDLNVQVSKQVKDMYDTLIKEYTASLKREYNVTSDAESLIVSRIVKNYLIADLADYTLLMFMGKYNVATGGIEMKRANAEVIKSLHELSRTANEEMVENLNILRILKGLPPIKKPRGTVEIH